MALDLISADEQYSLDLILGQEHEQEHEIKHLEGSILGLDGSGAIVRYVYDH